jgi:hypothetical protein
MRLPCRQDASHFIADPLEADSSSCSCSRDSRRPQTLVFCPLWCALSLAHDSGVLDCGCCCVCCCPSPPSVMSSRSSQASAAAGASTSSSSSSVGAAAPSSAAAAVSRVPSVPDESLEGADAPSHASGGAPAASGQGSNAALSAGPLRKRPQPQRADPTGDPDAYAVAKVEAESILRAETALPFEDRSFLGQLLSYETKAAALDDLVRNWYDSESADRVQREFADLKGKHVKVAAYAVGAPVFGTVDQTRKELRNVVRTRHEDAQGARSASDADDPEENAAAPESAEEGGFSQSPKVSSRKAGVPKARSPRASPPRPRRVSSPALRLLQQIPVVDDRPRSARDRRSGPEVPLAAPSQRRRPAGALPLPLLSPEDSPQGSDASDSDEDDPFPRGAGPRSDRLSRNDLRHRMAAAGVSKRMYPGFVANAKAASGGRSLYDLYKFEVTPRFREGSSHSKQECLALARIIDAALAGDMENVLELACRRLGGVHTAVETGNWEMCERLENEAEQRSFVPAEFMSSALQSVVRMQRVKASNGTSGASWNTPSGSGRAKPKSKSANGGASNSNASSSSHKKKNNKEPSRSQKKEGSSQQ